MTIAHVAARLAGGFLTPVDNEALRRAVNVALLSTNPGELTKLRGMPGAATAVMATLNKLWLAGIDLANYQTATEADRQRISDIRILLEATRFQLPANMLTPPDLVERALGRLTHAPRVFGSLQVRGTLDFSPVWRPLLVQLASHVEVSWTVLGENQPGWLAGTAIKLNQMSEESPEVRLVSAATAYDEVLEAFRWMRELLASGAAEPQQLAIAGTNLDDYDSYMLALRDDSSLPLHFVHGIPVTTTRAGQTAAALADALARGPSQERIRRLAFLVGRNGGLLSALPEDWTKVLSVASPLDRPEAWERFLNHLAEDDWRGQDDAINTLRRVVTILNSGLKAAEEAGETFLTGLARQVWRQALADGPSATIDQTLAQMRQADDSDPTTSAVWLAASQLTAAPRAHVCLLGLNSGAWPRSSAEDPLLPNHVIPTGMLDPIPTTFLDRAHFRTIIRTTPSQVVLSHARHGSEGRLLGRSPLLSDPVLGNRLPVQVLRRHRIPQHAMSERDRLTAREAEFRSTAHAASAATCWFNWNRDQLTPHDGIVRPNHPLVLISLARRQSPTSLSRLLRQPIGFVWRYALGIRDFNKDSESLVLDHLAVGAILHEIVNRVLLEMQKNPESSKPVTLLNASSEVGADWLQNKATPPKRIWESEMEDIRTNAASALEITEIAEPYSRFWTEVPFGGEGTDQPEEGTAKEADQPKQDPPWDTSAAVDIPNTGFSIGGRIDRLDMDDAGMCARVIDYKTGRPPTKPESVVLDGGKELQRSLYTLAVRRLLGQDTPVEAALVYPKQRLVMTLEDESAVIEKLSGYLVASNDALRAGMAVPGIDTTESYEEFALALPAFAEKYWERKRAAIAEALGRAADIWGEP